jgi:ribonuclease HI
VDTTLFFADGQIDIDYTIVHPTASSYVRSSASSEPLATAQQAKRRKLLHPSHAAVALTAQINEGGEEEADTNGINDLSGDECTKVIAFVAETYGGLHEDAREVIRDISIAAQHHLVTFTRSEIVCGLQSSIAIAIQRGNARAILASLNAAAAPSARYKRREVADLRFDASTPVSLLFPSFPGFQPPPRHSLASVVCPTAYRLFTDGASRDNGADHSLSSCGAALFPPYDGNPEHGRSVLDVSKMPILDKRSIPLGPSRTNNQAEYEAVIAGLLCAVYHRIDDVHVFADSQVVVDQVNGYSSCHNLHLQQLLAIVLDLKRCFDTFGITHIKRKHNKCADSLANEALDRDCNITLMEHNHFNQTQVRTMLDRLPTQASAQLLGSIIASEIRSCFDFPDLPIGTSEHAV